MQVDMERRGKAAVIRAQGDIDLYTSPRLREAILQALKERRTPIVVNLKDVIYMDSSGVATLIEGFQLAGEYGGVVRLVGLNERVSEVFKLARLHQVFTICQTEAQALENQPEQ